MFKIFLKVISGFAFILGLILLNNSTGPEVVEVDNVTVNSVVVNDGMYLISGEIALLNNKFGVENKVLNRYEMVWEITHDSGRYSVLVHDIRLGVRLPLNQGFKYYDTRYDQEIIQSNYDKFTDPQKRLFIVVKAANKEIASAFEADEATFLSFKKLNGKRFSVNTTDSGFVVEHLSDVLASEKAGALHEVLFSDDKIKALFEHAGIVPLGAFEAGVGFDLDSVKFKYRKDADSEYSAYLTYKPFSLTMHVSVDNSVAGFQRLKYTLENKNVVKDDSSGTVRNITFIESEDVYIKRIDNRPITLNEFPNDYVKPQPDQLNAD